MWHTIVYGVARSIATLTVSGIQPSSVQRPQKCGGVSGGGSFLQRNT